MAHIRPLFFVAALGLLLTACGGSDGPTDPGGNNNDDGSSGGETRTIKDDPSFASDIYPIFTRKGCTSGSCHGGGAGGLFLTTAAESYANLVNVASTGSGETLVVPSSAVGSYLVKKLEGTASVGQRMPLNGTPLDNIDLQNVKNWINQGAKNN